MLCPICLARENNSWQDANMLWLRRRKANHLQLITARSLNLVNIKNVQKFFPEQLFSVFLFFVPLNSMTFCYYESAVSFFFIQTFSVEKVVMLFKWLNFSSILNSSGCWVLFFPLKTTHKGFQSVYLCKLYRLMLVQTLSQSFSTFLKFD